MSVIDTDVDADTVAWIRNASDEIAVRKGCRFDVLRGAYTVWWIENMCRLYEGAHAGEPMILRGCAECEYDLPYIYDWDDEGEQIALARADAHAQCVRAGHRIDWQYDCTMRVFGWVKRSEHWKDWVRRFRKSKVYIAKKNKKSPTLSAWALYMTCGDGEDGQHCYLAAKDGAQVRDNTAKHIINMLEQSPLLDAECNLNKATLQITHRPTMSTCAPLSSSNERTQKSKEGLNGSVFIDETHVVDRKFVTRIDRAGISRKEPLHAEFSTAGDDPDSYGKEQFDICEKIIAGEIEDTSTFAAIYAAPQTLTDNDLAADPIKYAQMANPALGHTVDPAELLADYETSKASPATLASFKMYRLNIWQNSASPWLPMDGWDKGCRDFTAESFYGQTCWASLDLSSVSDFSSFTLAFPGEGDEISMLWWFWLPEATAKKFQHLIPIREWCADPRVKLMLTPGARIDYGYIRSTVRDLARQYSIQELAYDDWNAEQTTQEISEGVRDNSGRVIELPTGIQRVNFSQSLRAMNEPSKQFEARVIDGNILHNGDPLARWMVGNATIKPDQNGNYKPIKPADGVKKIDGVVTAVMALARAVAGDGTTWTYTKGTLAL